MLSSTNEQIATTVYVSTAPNAANSIAKIDAFDWGWLVISFGMALGAGVVMVPITVGMYGLMTFIICAIFAYPAIYLFQRLYINSLFGSKKPQCYSDNISSQLGSIFGSILGIIYFLMMAIWTIIYAELSCTTIFSYLSATITAHHLEHILTLEHVSLVIIIVLIAIGCKSQKLLFKISSVISILLLLCLLGAGALVLPHWDHHNAFNSATVHGHLFNGLMTMFPFALTTILFLQSLSPMVMSYRQKYHNMEFARRKCNFVMTLAFIILAVIILFFIVAFSGIISYQHATTAKMQNESVFTLMNHLQQNSALKVIGIIINFCAVLAAFLSIISGMRESLRGIILNIKRTAQKSEQTTNTSIELLIAVLIILITWIPIVIHCSVYALVPLCGPLFGIVGCLVPALLVFKTPTLHKFKGPSIYYTIIIGLILCLSPLF